MPEKTGSLQPTTIFATEPYGENIVLFDQIFGTYHNPDRPSSIEIGIKGQVAKGFLAQLAQPFSKGGVRQILGLPSKN